MNKRELKDFSLFVSSPFYNSNQNVIRLLGLLCEKTNKQNIHEQCSMKLDNKLLHKGIYGTKPYKEENIKTLIHLLTRLAEKFLAYNEFVNSPGEEKIKLMKAYDKRNLDKLFKKVEMSYGNELSEIKTLDLYILYRRMWFEKAKIDYYVKRSIEKELHQAEIRLSEITIAIFFVEMFRQYNMFWRLEYIDYEIDNEFVIPVIHGIDVQKIDKFLHEGKYKYYPLFEAYYCLYRSIDKDEDTASKFLERFMQIIDDKSSVIEKSEQFVLSTLLVNFIHFLYRRDFARYERSMFTSLKLLVSLYQYSGDKYMRINVFTSALRFGLQVKDYEWSRDFIERYSQMIEEEQRENMYNYGKCFLTFAMKDFEKVLEYESKIDYSTIQMKYYMRDVRLCSLYELEQFETALNLIDSYRHFIKKEKNFKGEMKKGYKEFVEFTSDLIKLKLGKSRVIPLELREKISASSAMRRNWLISKAEEFIKIS